MILSKSDGSVIQSTGLLAAADRSALQGAQATGDGTSVEHRTDEEVADGTRGVGRGNTAESVARMVFAYVNAAKEFADGLSGADEVKLLRMRTSKNEIVIVPGMGTLVRWGAGSDLQSQIRSFCSW